MPPRAATPTVRVDTFEAFEEDPCRVPHQLPRRTCQDRRREEHRRPGQDRCADARHRGRRARNRRRDADAGGRRGARRRQPIEQPRRRHTTTATTTADNGATSLPLQSFAGRTARRTPRRSRRRTPPPTRRCRPSPTGDLVKVQMTLKDMVVEIAPGVKYNTWAFDGHGAPGPIVHVREGQTVEMTLDERRRDPALDRLPRRPHRPERRVPRRRTRANRSRSASRRTTRACSCTTAARSRCSRTSRTACTARSSSTRRRRSRRPTRSTSSSRASGT